jgi:hypothetical protein
VPGRTDKINLNVKPGSYVIPADVVSIIGEGNTIAGTTVLRSMYGSKALTGKVAEPKGRPTLMERRLERHEMMPQGQYARGGRRDLGPRPEPPAEGMMWDPMPYGRGRGRQVPIANIERDMRNEMGDYDAYKDVPGSAANEEHWSNDPTYNMARPGARKRKMAEGGDDERTHGAAPVVVAGGEFVVDPDAIKRKYGDLAHGHKSLDELVHAARAYEIERLKNAPPPKK